MSDRMLAKKLGFVPKLAFDVPEVSAMLGG
jgi:hypothetical protein